MKTWLWVLIVFPSAADSKMTQVALQAHKKDLIRETPNFARKKFLYHLSRSDYERYWGKNYTKPGLAPESGNASAVDPKVGPFKGLGFNNPTHKRKICISRVSIPQSIIIAPFSTRCVRAPWSCPTAISIVADQPKRQNTHSRTRPTLTYWPGYPQATSTRHRPRCAITSWRSTTISRCRSKPERPRRNGKPCWRI